MTADDTKLDRERVRSRPDMQAHIQRVVDQAPPLTVEQQDRLASLLRAANSTRKET